MEGSTKLPHPEDDEDLEALRLAALQSFKRKSQTNNEMSSVGYFGGIKDKLTHFNGSPRGKHKRGKFSRSQQGRIPRNGQFNGWTRNSNLIAVPMVSEESPGETSTVSDSVPKLVLPQDRYFKVEKTAEKSDNLTSKFDRYNDSDESESESESEDAEERSDLKRSNSLDDLMAELENEIQGGASKPKEEKPKPKLKKKRKVSVSEETKPVETISVSVLKENLKPEVIEVKKPQPSNFVRQRKWQGKPPRRVNVPFMPPNLVHHPPAVPPEIIPPVIPFVPPPVQTFPPYGPMGFDSGYVAPIVFETPPPQLPPMHIAPPVYERPLSPLSVNTEAFSTSTLAPLSPRSAAFVLENRAIIEKRRRRSYSRSPSPLRFRRSKSPKRSSLSPKRLSKSPKRRSLSPSPVRKLPPTRTSSPKKPTIHERLGVKPAPKPETDQEKKKERPDKPKEEKKQEALDPVLEARRRKFERNEITMKEGVIRLKVKEDVVEEPKREEEQIEEEKEAEDDEEIEEIDEDALLEGGDDAILLDHKMDALFSDEESDSDNEGRFKTKQETNQKVAVLPFTKLMNGARGEVKTSLPPGERRNERRRRRYRSRSPLKRQKGAPKAAKKADKVKQNLTFPIDSRKIEIKIRNPAKYERTETKVNEEKNGPGNNRKVEIARKSEGEEDEGEINEGAEDASTSNVSEGDLRAQLSRKRAERQKHPLPDVVPSRLLQNALQGVGFRKGKKNKSKDENAEGKLPIHMRLGAANGSEVFGKKSRKHKNKGSQEQV